MSILASIRPKRTVRSVIDLSDASGESLTLPLEVLRDIVHMTPEFSGTASATFSVRAYGGGGGYSPRTFALRSLVIEEER